MKIVIISLILVCSSCSTRSKSKKYGAISGALICGGLGSSLGTQLSPNRESDSLNRNIGAVTGALLCGAIGYYVGGQLYDDDPENFEGEKIKFNNEKKNSKQEILNEDLADLNLSDLEFSKDGEAQTPFIKNLPDKLKRKIKKQKIIKYKIKPQTIKTKDGRTLYFSGGDAMEHIYQEQ